VRGGEISIAVLDTVNILENQRNKCQKVPFFGIINASDFGDEHRQHQSYLHFKK